MVGTVLSSQEVLAEEASSRAATEAASTSTAADPGEPDFMAFTAEEHHSYILKLYVVRNRLKRRFQQALLALEESGKHILLGFSSIAQYARKYFGYKPAYTYELLRTVKALAVLPLSDAAFREGTLSWSALREMTRIAEPETEAEWLEFARKHPVSRLKAEVKDALLHGRKKPRKGRYGLPGLKVRLVFELAPEEQDLARKALLKVAREMEQSLGAEEDGGEREEKRVQLRDAFLLLCRRLLLSERALAEGSSEGEEALYTIAYRYCPQCRAAHVLTAEGPVEIAPEVVERVEGEAEWVVIRPEEEAVAGTVSAADSAADSDTTSDTTSETVAEAEARPKLDRPNTRSLRRKVLLRDGNVCANPLCGRTLHLQAHHIVFRSDGGRTALWNEVAVCAVCHSMCHAGLISVKRTPDCELLWSRKADELPGPGELARELLEAMSVPVPGVQSTRVDSQCAPELSAATQDLDEDEDVVSALRGLGYAAGRARQHVARARVHFGRSAKEPSAEELLAHVLRHGGN